MFAALALKNSARNGSVSRMTAPTNHVTPLAGRELRALLNGPEASAAPFAELREVERNLRLRPSLEHLGPAVLRTALGQLDAVGCRTPALGMLRLKLARQIARDDATVQAARTGEPMRWYPSAVVMKQRKSDRDVSTVPLESGFADTESSTQALGEEPSS
jgi:hypothetical protein